MQEWRIHGDNIIECHRALTLIETALATTSERVDGPAYAPRFLLNDANIGTVTIVLFPGYGRWGIDIPLVLRSHGARLREAADAVVTKVTKDSELILFAIEFCGALPAGNNAWQRHGRALAFAEAGVPYLYFAEVGGAELDNTRTVKAPRFPNPIVPFSYVSASRVLDTLCLPVFLPSASISETLRHKYQHAFGPEEASHLIAALLRGKDIETNRIALESKALMMVTSLSASRAGRTTLQGEEWSKMLDEHDLSGKADLIKSAGLFSTRRSPAKVPSTETVQTLISRVNETRPLGPGTVNLPIQIVQSKARIELARAIEEIYGSRMQSLATWVRGNATPLIIVWMTGFKPSGEDSRPDRGLLPMTRMLFGEDTDVMAIVWGPGRPQLLELLAQDPSSAASQNGLVETIVNLSDAYIIDCSTQETPFSVVAPIRDEASPTRASLPLASLTPSFSEHDIDSVFHHILSSSNDKVFESMCNPPGGDWSGLSLVTDTPAKSSDWPHEYRWTSLPRVSGAGTKRPDHVAQFLAEDVILAIESKTFGAALEAGVGPAMILYLRHLLASEPIASRTSGGVWRLRDAAAPRPTFSSDFISAGAFVWSGLENLRSAMRRGDVDLCFAVEFAPEHGRSLLHTLMGPRGERLKESIFRLVQGSAYIDIEVHEY